MATLVILESGLTFLLVVLNKSSMCAFLEYFSDYFDEVFIFLLTLRCSLCDILLTHDHGVKMHGDVCVVMVLKEVVVVCVCVGGGGVHSLLLRKLSHPVWGKSPVFQEKICLYTYLEGTSWLEGRSK